MFTLVVYTQDVDTGTALRYINPISDPHVRVEPPNVIVPAGLNYLCGAFAFGTTLTGARIETPSLRRTVLYELSEVISTATLSYPFPMTELFYTPLPLDEYEPMRALASKSDTTTQRSTVLVWLGDGPQSPVTGEIYTVTATWSGALTAWEWGNRALSLSQTLPAGLYQVVGMSAVHAAPVAARLVFVGGTWRPGVLARSGVGTVDKSIFRRGGLGVWGEFRHDQPPTVDLLTSSTTASGTVYLDVIKTG